MPVPLIVWGGVALAGVILGSAGTVAVTDAADELGDAVEQGTNSINKLLKTTAIVGAGYLAYRHRKELAAFLKGRP